MSVFGSLMGDMENDPIFGSHMRQMRHMSNMMNSLFSDPFAMMRGPMGGGFGDFENRALTHRHNNMHNSLMSPFSMPMMPNFNRLLSGSLDSMNTGNFSSSSTVISMTSGPDGRPQVYKATSSTRVAPGGIKETQKTVTDSVTGTKKMSIGHHIGERAHIIEKEQNMITGDREEREDLINVDEDEKEEFDTEWEVRARNRSEIPRITGSSRNRHSYGGHPTIPAITAGSSSRRHRDHRVSATSTTPLVSSRRSIRSSKLALPMTNTSTSSSLARTPYSPPNQQNQPRKSKNIKSVSGGSPRIEEPDN